MAPDLSTRPDLFDQVLYLEINSYHVSELRQIFLMNAPISDQYQVRDWWASDQTPFARVLGYFWGSGSWQLTPFHVLACVLWACSPVDSSVCTLSVPDNPHAGARNQRRGDCSDSGCYSGSDDYYAPLGGHFGGQDRKLQGESENHNGMIRKFELRKFNVTSRNGFALRVKLKIWVIALFLILKYRHQRGCDGSIGGSIVYTDNAFKRAYFDVMQLSRIRLTDILYVYC